MSLLDYLFGGPKDADAASFDPYGEENEAPNAKARGQAVMAQAQQPTRGMDQQQLVSFVDALLANQIAGGGGGEDAKPWNGWQQLRASDRVEVRPHQEPTGPNPVMPQEWRHQEVSFPMMGGVSRQDRRGEMPGVDNLLNGQATVDPYEFSDAWMNDTRGTPIYSGSPGSLVDIVRELGRKREPQDLQMMRDFAAAMQDRKKR